MPSRRTTLIAVGSTLISSLAGCLDIIGSSSTVRDVYVLLENGNDSSQTFHFTFEIEDGTLDRESHTLDADASKSVIIEPPEGSIPVAFHGKINRTERTFKFDDLDDADDEICLYMYFNYQKHPRNNVYITRNVDLSCY